MESQYIYIYIYIYILFEKDGITTSFNRKEKKFNEYPTGIGLGNL